MIEPRGALPHRPRLSPKVRLRWDRSSQRHLLVPEKGPLLSSTAADIAALCTGHETVFGIVDRLAEKYGDQPREVLERAVVGFLEALALRGLLRDAGDQERG